MKIRFKIYNLFRNLLALILVVYAAISIYRFAELTEHTKSEYHIYEITFWVLGPPIWFFLERYFMVRGNICKPEGDSNNEFLSRSRDFADMASKIWAAVLFVLIFMYPK